MSSRFKWILNCLDNSSVYILEKDPVGWDTCSYRMERHSAYKGIFNQFTSSLKFHRMGGGKQWVDNIYKTFDIDAQVNITVLIDADGAGINYDTLFTGRLNFASYSEDGTYTMLNIEQSDIFTKLNTRADIAVPLNVVSVKGGYYSSGNWVGYSFSGNLLETSDANQGSGSWLINDPFITIGNTYYVQTADQNSNNLTCQVNFTGGSNYNNGTQTDGNTQITINSNIATGFMQVDYVNLSQPLLLYIAGTQQKSLGQQIINTVPTQTINLPGIPLQYESRFTFTDNARSGTNIVFDESGKYTFSIGEIISVTAQDVNGYLVYDQVTYNGTGTAGAGMVTADGLTSIHITSTSLTSVTISFTNAYGPIDLFVGAIGALNGTTGGTGLPVGQNIDTYVPVGAAAEQVFVYPQSGNVGWIPGQTLGGFVCFDATTIFDNLNEFVLAKQQDIAIPAKSTSNTSIVSIMDGITEPNITYPVTIEWAIHLKGTLSEHLGSDAARTIQFGFTLAYGGGQTASGGQALSDASTTRRSLFLHNPTSINDVGATYSFDTGALSGSFTLNEGDQVWLYSYITESLHAGTINSVSAPFTYVFEKSEIDFKITTNVTATSAQALMVHEAFNQVVDSIADSDRNFYSEFYGRTNSAKISYAANGAGSLRVLTNGLCIRGHLDKYISMSLNDIFNSMNAIDNIGLEIDAQNRVRVEPLSFFFDRQTQIALLPNVNKIKTLNENSYYINQVEVGYDKWETEIYFKNGLDEVHAKRLYATKVGSAKGTVLQSYNGNTTGFLKVNGKLSAISKFIAGNYTIELTRRKNLQWSQDDFKYDNDSFIICLGHSIRVSKSDSFAGAVFNPPRLPIGAPADYGSITLYYAPGILPNDIVTISGTAHNNGRYMVMSVDTYIPGSATTTIRVSANLVNGNNLTNETSATALLNFVNSTFVETAGSILQQPVQNVIDSALSTQWLNMSITPARMLQAQMNRITAGLQIIGGKVQFLGGSGNFKAATQMYSTGTQQDYNGNWLYENASFNYNDPNMRNVEPLWLPEVYRFEYPITYRQFKQIKANPNGFITFYKFSNDVKFGFILHLDYQVKTGMAKFELLRMNPPAAIDGVVNEDGSFILL